MKRSWIKRSAKPLRRTPLRKKGKQKISTIQNKIWKLCKTITRKRCGNSCYTCGRTGLSGNDWQTGHMWAKASVGAYLKYDLRILKPQCFSCNIHKGGMGADFYKRMLSEIGEEEMQKLEKDRLVILDGQKGRPTAMQHYLNLLSEYQGMI